MKRIITILVLVGSLGATHTVVARADSVQRDASLISVYVKKFELEYDRGQSVTEVILQKERDNDSMSAGKVLVSDSPRHQIILQMLLSAFNTQAAVDVTTDENGYVTRIELERIGQ